MVLGFGGRVCGYKKVVVCVINMNFFIAVEGFGRYNGVVPNGAVLNVERESAKACVM